MSLFTDPIQNWFNDLGDSIQENVLDPVSSEFEDGWDDFMYRYSEWGKWQRKNMPVSDDPWIIFKVLNIVANIVTGGFVSDYILEQLPFGNIVTKWLNYSQCLLTPNPECIQEIFEDITNLAGIDPGFCLNIWSDMDPDATSIGDLTDNMNSRIAAAECLERNFNHPQGSSESIPNITDETVNSLDPNAYCPPGFNFEPTSRLCRSFCPQGSRLQNNTCINDDDSRASLQCPIGTYYDMVYGCVPACPYGYMYYGGDTCIKTSNPDVNGNIVTDFNINGTTVSFSDLIAERDKRHAEGPEFVKTKIEYPKFFFSSLSLAVTADEIFTTDHFNDCVVVYDFNGNLKRKFGTSGDGDGQFNTPTGIAITMDGKIVVADSKNSRIQVFN